MSRSSLESGLRTEMSAVGINLSSDMLSKCVALARNHNLTPSEIAMTWETHSLNHNVTSLNKHTYQSFRTSLTSSISKTKKKKHDSTTITPKKRAAVVHRPPMGRRSHNQAPSRSNENRAVKRKVDFAASNDENDRNNSNGVHASPLSTSKTTRTTSDYSPSASITASGSSAVVTPSKNPKDKNDAYENRKNSGQVVTTYNPQKLDSLPPMSFSQKVEISEPYGSLKQYKYMTDKDRSSALNSHLNSFQTKMCEQVQDRIVKSGDGGDNDDVEPMIECVGVPRQATQINFGRICNEAHEGKMNKTTILLEGSKQGSNGARISLDVSKIEKSFSCFPGQIVGVRGVNSSGRKMVVEEIIKGVETEVVKSHKDELKRIYNESMNENGTKIFAVAGPYTTSQNLDYEPLTDLLNLVAHEKPAAVVLMGPFVDLRQPLVKDGDQVTLEYENDSGGTVTRNVSFETLFAAKISQELECLYDEFPDLNTKFVLVPSLEDAVSEPIFPQPPIADTLPDGGKIMNEIEVTEEFPFGSLRLESIETAKRKMPKDISERRVHLVSNPSTIKINDITIGMTSTDSLFHLSTQEINQRLRPGSRISRLAEHFIQQQSYYPIFPAPSLPGLGFNLDLNMRSGYNMPVQPDILLLPSRLACLVKDVTGGTVVINPGHLVKGANGGSYAVVDIHPINKEKLEEEKGEEIVSNVKDRIRVEIRKI